MMYNEKEPIPISGPKATGPNAVPRERKVIWKKLCLIQDFDEDSQKYKINDRECIIEMSRTKIKFYIVAVDLQIFKYHVIELYRAQANKIILACNNNLVKLMSSLHFKFGVL